MKANKTKILNRAILIGSVIMDSIMQSYAYILGLFYGDGTLHKGKNGAYQVWIDQSSKNKYILEFATIPRLKLMNVKPYFYQFNDWRHQLRKYRLALYSKALFEKLKEVKQDPVKYLKTLEDSEVVYFIAGLFDSEGTKTDRLVIYNGNLRLLEEVKRRLNNFNIHCKIYKFGSIYGLQIHRKTSVEIFLKLIPSYKLTTSSPG